jgi:hypothetical protein
MDRRCVSCSRAYATAVTPALACVRYDRSVESLTCTLAHLYWRDAPEEYGATAEEYGAAADHAQVVSTRCGVHVCWRSFTCGTHLRSMVPPPIDHAHVVSTRCGVHVRSQGRTMRIMDCGLWPNSSDQIIQVIPQTIIKLNAYKKKEIHVFDKNDLVV